MAGTTQALVQRLQHLVSTHKETCEQADLASIGEGGSEGGLGASEQTAGVEILTVLPLDVQSLIHDHLFRWMLIKNIEFCITGRVT